MLEDNVAACASLTCNTKLGRKGDTPLEFAVRVNAAKCINYFLAHTRHISWSKLRTVACQKGHVSLVSRFLSCVPRRRLLNVAAYWGQIKVCEYLSQIWNMSLRSGSLLAFAICGGNLPFVRFLVETRNTVVTSNHVLFAARLPRHKIALYLVPFARSGPCQYEDPLFLCSRKVARTLLLVHIHRSDIVGRSAALKLCALRGIAFLKAKLCESQDLQSLVMVAMMTDQVRIVRWIYYRGHCNSRDWARLLYVAVHRRAERIAHFIAQNHSLQDHVHLNDEGHTALCEALEWGSLSLCRALKFLARQCGSELVHAARGDRWQMIDDLMPDMAREAWTLALDLCNWQTAEYLFDHHIPKTWWNLRHALQKTKRDPDLQAHYVHKWKHPFDKDLWYWSARKGHVNYVKLLFDKASLDPKEAIYMATKYNQTNVVAWFFLQGVKYSPLCLNETSRTFVANAFHVALLQSFPNILPSALIELTASYVRGYKCWHDAMSNL